MLSLKQQVIEMIATIDDEQLPELVKSDIEHFRNSNADILDELNNEDKEELLNLINEPHENNILTEDEFKAATARWRTK